MSKLTLKRGTKHTTCAHSSDLYSYGLQIQLILLLMLILFVCLDKFWMHQYVIYDFTADLTGIGDRSVRESS